MHSPPERERDPLIGDLSGDEFAQCRTRLIVLVDEGSNDISGKLRLSVPGPGVRIPFNPARVCLSGAFGGSGRKGWAVAAVCGRTGT